MTGTSNSLIWALLAREIPRTSRPGRDPAPESNLGLGIFATAANEAPLLGFLRRREDLSPRAGEHTAGSSRSNTVALPVCGVSRDHAVTTTSAVDIERYRGLLEAAEELDAIRAYDAAKASGDEAIPFEQAIAEIEQGLV